MKVRGQQPFGDLSHRDVLKHPDAIPLDRRDIRREDLVVEAVGDRQGSQIRVELILSEHVAPAVRKPPLGVHARELLPVRVEHWSAVRIEHGLVELAHLLVELGRAQG